MEEQEGWKDQEIPVWLNKEGNMTKSSPPMVGSQQIKPKTKIPTSNTDIVERSK